MVSWFLHLIFVLRVEWRRCSNCSTDDNQPFGTVGPHKSGRLNLGGSEAYICSRRIFLPRAIPPASCFVTIQSYSYSVLTGFDGIVYRILPLPVSAY